MEEIMTEDVGFSLQALSSFFYLLLTLTGGSGDTLV